MSNLSTELQEAIGTVNTHARENALGENRPDGEIASIEVGQKVQQGDIYVVREPDAAENSVEALELLSEGEAQIAVGVNIGARHLAKGPIKVYKAEKAPSWLTVPEDMEPLEMTGPIIVAADRWSVEHPKHGKFSMPEGRFQVVYQYDPRTMKRVVD